jgi:hypothetical protein
MILKSTVVLYEYIYISSFKAENYSGENRSMILRVLG